MKSNPWASRPLYRNADLFGGAFNELAEPVEADTDTPRQTRGGAGSDAQSQARPDARPAVAEAPVPVPVPPSAPQPGSAPVPKPSSRTATLSAPMQRPRFAPLDPGEPLDVADRLDFERAPRRSNAQLGPNSVAAQTAPSPLPAAVAAALPAAPPAGANERPVDPAWLAQRERALVGFRAEYDAARAGAEAGGVSFGRIGPGWVLTTLSTDESGQVHRGAGQIEVLDPTAEPVIMGWDESGAVFISASQTYEFDEANFAASYRTRSAAQPSASLLALAAAYDTGAATLFTQRPELWSLATADHALNAGPALPGFAMGNPQQLGLTDLYLADPQIAALIQAYGGASPAPARSAIGLEQARLYGERRSAQLSRLGTAMASVREQYSAALADAQAGNNAAGWTGGEPRYATDESGFRVGGPIVSGFEVDAFTAWYIAQPGLQHKAFGDFYGASHTTHTTDESGARTSTYSAFDNPNWSASGPGDGFGALEHSELVSLALDHAPELINDAAVGFDFEAGWSTSRANLHQDKDWMGTLAMVVMIAAVAWASAGTLGPAVATSMGITGATGTMIVTAAVAGASTSLVSGILNDNLSLKGVLIGALSGALTVGLLQGVGAVVGNLSPVGAIAARTTVQGAVQALLGGSFKDGAIAGFASGLADVVSVNMKGGIEKAFKTGAMTAAEAAAARTFARVVGSAIRAAASPNDPGQAFASAFLDDLFRQVELRAPVSGASNAPGAPGAPVLTSNDASVSSGVQPSPLTPLWMSADGRTVLPSAAGTAPVGTLRPFEGDQPEYPDPSLLPTNARVIALQDDAGVIYWRVIAAGLDTVVAEVAAPSNAAVIQLEPVVVTGRRIPRIDSTDAQGNALVTQGDAASLTTLMGTTLVVTEVGKGFALREAATAGARLLVALARLASMPATALLALFTPTNATEQFVDLGGGERFRTRPGELYGELQRQNPDGQWLSMPGQIRLDHLQGRSMLSDEERERIGAPLTTPADPRATPPLFTPLPSDRDRAQPLPGMTIDPPAAGSLPGYEAMPPLTIGDLLTDKQNSEVLGDNLRASGSTKPAEGYEAHHIVPSGAGGPKMEVLRARLAELGIDLNDAANGVWLPGPKAPEGATEAYHRRLNNAEYNNAVDQIFRGVANRQDALAALERIESRLKDGSFPGIRPRPKP